MATKSQVKPTKKSAAPAKQAKAVKKSAPAAKKAAAKPVAKPAEQAASAGKAKKERSQPSRVFKHANGNIIVIDYECGLILQHSGEVGQSSVSAIADDTGIFLKTFEESPDMTEINIPDNDSVCLDKINDKIEDVLAAIKSQS